MLNQAKRYATIGLVKMKKNIVILSSLLIASQIMATPIAEIGEKFCKKVIDAVSPGSNHVLVCLNEVKNIMKKNIKDQTSLIHAICKRAPEFPYASGTLTRQQCLKKALEQGFLKTKRCAE